MKGFFGSSQKQSAEEVRASNILHFDHTYKARLAGCSAGACPEPAESIADDNSEVLEGGRQCKLTMTSRGVHVSETIGASISELRDRNIFQTGYFSINEIAWDHSVSGVKLTTAPEQLSPSAADRASSEPRYLILHVENSLELERDLRLRLKGAAQPGARFPLFQYVGMFAGPTKPKPFQRKRPNLTHKAQAKLPPLAAMRQWAMEHHRGAMKPLAPGEKSRIDYALDHIHTGRCDFLLSPSGASGPGGFAEACSGGATLSVAYDGLNVANTLGRSAFIPFRGVQTVVFRDSLHASSSAIGVDVGAVEGHYYIPVPLSAMRHCRASVEYFWNMHRRALDFPAMPCSTHGRSVVRCHTLQGEEDAPPPPLGDLDIAESDGTVVRAAPKGAPQRRRSSGGGPGGFGGDGGGRVLRRSSSLFGSPKNQGPAIPRPAVAGHWDKMVRHQGWLQKRGGAAKQWIPRYFVLYSTAQGHFLSYYSDVRQSPLYKEGRSERNTIDLCKVTFIRPVAKGQDAPEHAFDLVTIEREWTLGAANHEDMQVWLKMITRAVDEDACVVPDDQLDFRVKALQDPSRTLARNDYNTSLRVGAMGVSVSSVRSDDFVEHYFWCYTDFYKWSMVAQGPKLALLLNVFMTQEFSAKQEFIFRTPMAPQLATAIEFYIEKFMSVMHISREDEDAPPPTPQRARDDGPRMGAGAAEDLGAPAPVVDLLDAAWNDDETDAKAEADAERLRRAQRGSIYAPANGSGAARSGETDLLSFGSVGGGTVKSTKSTSILDDLGMADLAVSSPPPAPQVASPAPAAAAAAASPAPAPAVPADDPFALGGDDGFGGGAAAPAALTAQEAAAAERAALALMLSGDRGALAATGALSVAAAVEYRGSQARVTLRLEAVAAALSDFGVKIGGGAPADAVRHNGAAAPGGTASAGAPLAYVLLAECMKPFERPPRATISFSAAGGRRHSYELPLPLSVLRFVEPVQMEMGDFQARWQAMAAGGQALQAVVTPPSPASVPAASVAALFRRLRSFGACGAPGAAASGVTSQCFAGTLRTGKEARGPGGEVHKISAGCLVVVETNEGAGVHRLNVRSVHASVSSAIFGALRELLEADLARA